MIMQSNINFFSKVSEIYKIMYINFYFCMCDILSVSKKKLKTMHSSDKLKMNLSLPECSYI